MIQPLRAATLGAAIIVGMLASAGCSSGSSDTPAVPAEVFVGADGVAVDGVDTSRIVTLSGDITEFVFEMGLGDSIVATDLTTVAPPEAVDLPKVGIGRFLNAEGVLKYDPTLVIGDTQTSPAAAIEQIRATGVPVAILDVPTTFDGLSDKVTQIGLLLDTPEEAQALSDRMSADIAAASPDLATVGDRPRVAYVYTRGPDVVLLFGEGMTTAPVITAAGGLDAGIEAGVERTITVTPEALAAAAPDVIVLPSEGYAVLGGYEGLMAIPGFAATPAGISGAILAYPEGDFLTFGPRIAASIAILSDDLAKLRTNP
jgi:iron complex transport system substrate-binding protein